MPRAKSEQLHDTTHDGASPVDDHDGADQLQQEHDDEHPEQAEQAYDHDHEGGSDDAQDDDENPQGNGGDDEAYGGGEGDEYYQGHADASATATPEDIAAAWTQTWDETSREYYWWNTITNDTAWDDPREQQQQQEQQQQEAHEDEGEGDAAQKELDAVLDTIDATVKAKLDGQAAPAIYPQQANAPGTTAYAHSHSMAPAASSYLGTEDPYRFQAYFNPKSGKFQSGSDALQRTPGAYSQTTRAMKQMEAFFDVNAYQEQRNRQLQQPERKRQLSRKDIERFKRAKKEKKLNRFRDWLKD